MLYEDSDNLEKLLVVPILQHNQLTSTRKLRYVLPNFSTTQ